MLGNRAFPAVGRRYRAVFVDIQRVVDFFPEMAGGSHVLDIGGGDGDIINILFEKHPDIRVTMIDLAPRVGEWLNPRYRKGVVFLPGTSIEKYVSSGGAPPDYIIISDVIHHIPNPDRPKFFNDLKSLVGKNNVKIIIKDIQPGYMLSYLSYFCDKYISGDKTVLLISKEEVAHIMGVCFPNMRCVETELFKTNKPNYCLVFS